MNHFRYRIFFLFFMALAVKSIDMHAQGELVDLEAVVLQNPATNVYSVGWCDECGYIAVGLSAPDLGTPDIIVYSFDKDTNTLTQVATANGSGQAVTSIAWSDDCSYLAAEYGSSEVIVYNFDTVNSLLIPIDTAVHGNDVRSVDWCDTSSFLAIGGDPSGGSGTNTTDIRVYSFDGSLLTQVATATHGQTVNSVAWCDGCNYLAIGGLRENEEPGTPSVRVYDFNSLTLTLTQIDAINAGTIVYSVAWSDDCSYLAVNTSSALRVYSFDGASLTLVTSESGGGRSVAWCDGHNYLAASVDGTDSVVVYEFDGMSLTDVVTKDLSNPIIWSLNWCNECEYLAVGANSDPSLIIYRSVYQQDAPVLIKSSQRAFCFPTQMNLANCVRWEPVDGALEYHVYTDEDLTNRLFTTRQPYFSHNCRKPCCEDTYYIVAAFSDGIESKVLTVTVP